jgi:hypothetical protein
MTRMDWLKLVGCLTVGTALGKIAGMAIARAIGLS